MRRTAHLCKNLKRPSGSLMWRTRAFTPQTRNAIRPSGSPMGQSAHPCIRHPNQNCNADHQIHLVAISTPCTHSPNQNINPDHLIHHVAIRTPVHSSPYQSKPSGFIGDQHARASITQPELQSGSFEPNLCDQHPCLHHPRQDFQTSPSGSTSTPFVTQTRKFNPDHLHPSCAISTPVHSSPKHFDSDDLHVAISTVHSSPQQETQSRPSESSMWRSTHPCIHHPNRKLNPDHLDPSHGRSAHVHSSLNHESQTRLSGSLMWRSTHPCIHHPNKPSNQTIRSIMWRSAHRAFVTRTRDSIQII